MYLAQQMSTVKFVYKYIDLYIIICYLKEAVFHDGRTWFCKKKYVPSKYIET